ncbi:hypothetical protein [Marinobacter sp. OP 3.4]|uniref:hypothetical protein n=1 Tax=Marinobacter sp. OP 3.4 TaxID=3076501 RepID=UPI002E2189B1
MAENNVEQWLADCGKPATITILPTKDGIQLALRFGEEKANLEKPTMVQGLALVGCEAIRKAIRDQLDVRSEEVVRMDAQDQKSH